MAEVAVKTVENQVMDAFEQVFDSANTKGHEIVLDALVKIKKIKVASIRLKGYIKLDIGTDEGLQNALDKYKDNPSFFKEAFKGPYLSRIIK